MLLKPNMDKLWLPGVTVTQNVVIHFTGYMATWHKVQIQCHSSSAILAISEFVGNKTGNT